MVDEFGAGQLAAKAVIDYAVFATGNPNKKVRDVAMKLFAMLYKHLGEAVRHFLAEVKESTMKLVEDEFKKVTPLKKGEFVSARGVKGEAAEEAAANP